MNTAFFLGANTPQGFASYYDQWLDLRRLNRLYIIKGTPGNGKSGFMRRVAGRLAEKGYGNELILCSSDPKSLDGVYFPELGVAFADGTAPHVMEPRYPLAVECYLPLTQFVNDAALARERGAVILLRDGLQGDYARLSRVLTAVRSLRDEQRAIVSGGAALDTIRRRARGVLRREVRKGTGGVLRKRFLSAPAPEGGVVLWDTVQTLADKVYELQDSYGQAHELLAPVLEAALEAGQEVIACYDPCAPFTRLAHLILPGLRLAFVSATAKEPYPGEIYRRVRLDAAIPRETAHQNRLRLRFLRKTEAALTQDAREILARASEKHVQLEELYNPHVDFAGVRALADAYADKVLLDRAE
ncbi:MAG: hypothetical protein LBH95_10055 [Oscillospiraceae bacterium]|jgi:hypothetical protein|nr:hypothetical protein [Oscillospiraceae bacterium]